MTLLISTFLLVFHAPHGKTIRPGVVHAVNLRRAAVEITAPRIAFPAHR
jgi:hypothetical protein